MFTILVLLAGAGAIYYYRAPLKALFAKKEPVVEKFVQDEEAKAKTLLSEVEKK